MTEGVRGVLWGVVAVATAVPLYAYLVYPLALKVFALLRNRETPIGETVEWPRLTVTVPAYNEETAIGRTLERLLAVDYPKEQMHVLVVSDASSDRTDEIVAGFADRGVELHRLPERGGKTAAENAACARLEGDIVVNTDASVLLDAGSMKPLIAAFSDPSVGVASGRDVSVANVGDVANVGEAGYVGYEMWVRDLETQVDGIVGASGCFYASRVPLHMELVPSALSRDFAAPLIARERGYRSVTVNDAVCYVPRTPSLRREYSRKVRTMARGLETLYYKRHLLSPIRYGTFAWMLWSHKLIRWLVPWAALAGVVGAAALAPSSPIAAVAVAATVGVAAAAMVGWLWPSDKPTPKVVSVPAYVVSGIVAGLHAWVSGLRRELNPIWEPTRRERAGGKTDPR